MQHQDTGRLADLDAWFHRLFSVQRSGAFLMVFVDDTENFIQFSPGPLDVKMEFPLVTPQQQGLETEMRQVGEKLGMQVNELKGTDGTRFLNYTLDRDPQALVTAAREVLTAVFGANEESRLVFKHFGLEGSATEKRAYPY